MSSAPLRLRRVYSLRSQPLAEIDEWLGRYRALWEEQLDALHTPSLPHPPNRGSTRYLLVGIVRAMLRSPGLDTHP